MSDKNNLSSKLAKLRVKDALAWESDENITILIDFSITYSVVAFCFVNKRNF
jgi:hypothetical protein